MPNVTIREPKFEDKENFLQAMQQSQALHHPWVSVPLTSEEFDDYLQRASLPDQKRFLVCKPSNDIAGVFNVSGIVRGFFQSAYLGFYAVSNYAGLGFMSSGLKLVLRYVFEDLKLHRLEANIQPENTRSIQLVKNNRFRYEGFSPRYLKVNDKWCGHEHWVITAEDYIADTPDILKKDHINLVPYNSAWPKLAQEEIDKIKSVFPINTILDIQHVGSTAVPGLSAKPILDLQIAVNSLDNMKFIAIPILQKLGYEYWDANPDPSRMFFAKGMPPYGEGRTHHVHIVEPTSAHWHEKIKFRDYLIAHPQTAKAYQQLKISLAQQYPYAREEYTNAKDEFINKILKLAQ